jgi:hypothetical protein
MDENSYLMSCPDDECIEKEGREVMLSEWWSDDDWRTNRTVQNVWTVGYVQSTETQLSAKLQKKLILENNFETLLKFYLFKWKICCKNK